MDNFPPDPYVFCVCVRVCVSLLHWQELPALYWIKVAKVDIYVLFSILGICLLFLSVLSALLHVFVLLFFGAHTFKMSCFLGGVTLDLSGSTVCAINPSASSSVVASPIFSSFLCLPSLFRHLWLLPWISSLVITSLRTLSASSFFPP